jgi:hypothetical protein
MILVRAPVRNSIVLRIPVCNILLYCNLTVCPDSLQYIAGGYCTDCNILILQSYCTHAWMGTLCYDSAISLFLDHDAYGMYFNRSKKETLLICRRWMDVYTLE